MVSITMTGLCQYQDYKGKYYNMEKIKVKIPSLKWMEMK